MQALSRRRIFIDVKGVIGGFILRSLLYYVILSAAMQALSRRRIFIDVRGHHEGKV
jgi:hypothetical protein